jgi:prepilin-type N-terminal cleavage/methylation domain-containing protein
MSSNRGFTLLELLVVIAIVGILASIILVALGSAVTQAKVARAKTEMNELVAAMGYAKSQGNKTLGQIDNSWWSMAPCVLPTQYDLRGNTGSCYTNWINALNAIQPYTAGVYDHLFRFDRDPWGSPYLLDENEGEPDWGTGNPPCYQDKLSSAGPDGIALTSDDITMYVPHATGQCL